MILLLLACQTVEEPPPTVDCASEPVVTWENFGQGLIIENCSSCHSETSANRHGAPDTVLLDTHGQVRTWKDRILVVTENGTMPPALTLSEESQHLISVWLQCWE